MGPFDGFDSSQARCRSETLLGGIPNPECPEQLWKVPGLRPLISSDCLGLEALAMQLFCVAMYLHPGWPLKRPFLFRHACLFFQALRSKHEKQQHASLTLGPPALRNFNNLRKAVSTRWKPYWGTFPILKNLQKICFQFCSQRAANPNALDCNSENISSHHSVSRAFSLYTSFRHMRSRARGFRAPGAPWAPSFFVGLVCCRKIIFCQNVASVACNHLPLLRNQTVVACLCSLRAWGARSLRAWGAVASVFSKPGLAVGYSYCVLC